MKKYSGGGVKKSKGAAGSGRVNTKPVCWDGKKQGPASKGMGFGSK